MLLEIGKLGERSFGKPRPTLGCTATNNDDDNNKKLLSSSERPQRLRGPPKLPLGTINRNSGVMPLLRWTDTISRGTKRLLYPCQWSHKALTSKKGERAVPSVSVLCSVLNCISVAAFTRNRLQLGAYKYCSRFQWWFILRSQKPKIAHTSHHQMMEWQMNWRSSGRKRLRRNQRLYRGICREEMGKTTERVIQDSRSADRDLNPWHKQEI